MVSRRSSALLTRGVATAAVSRTGWCLSTSSHGSRPASWVRCGRQRLVSRGQRPPGPSTGLPWIAARRPVTHTLDGFSPARWEENVLYLLYLAGTHAASTLAAAHFIADNIVELHRDLKNWRFSMVIVCDYDPEDRKKILSTKPLTPIYRPESS